MASSEIKTFTFGKINGIIHDFAKIGDELPTHVHDESTNHMTIIARGAFKCTTDTWEKELKAGDVIDWPAGVNHSFVALKRNSRLVNILK